MFLTRSTFGPIIACSLSLIALTGCPNAGTQPPVSQPSGTASPAASTDPGASASASPSAVPTDAASQAPGAGAAPSAAPSAPNTPVVTVQGKVFNEASAPVEAAVVRVRSLNPAVKFDSTVNSSGGTYVMNGVPSGVQLEISATKPNWTTRTRVESLIASTNAINTVNFGGPNETADQRGAGYFISNFPEISSASGVYDGAKTVFTLKVSEPLNGDNQRLVDRAISVSAPDGLGGFTTFRPGTTFLGDRVTAKTEWNAEGTQMTFTFEAPLRASKTDKKSYTLSLARATGEDVIKDGEGNPLGLTAPVAPGNYSEAIKLSSLVLTTESTGAARWNTTHTGTSAVEVAKDETAPKLVSVTSSPIVSNNVESVRFVLTFSEPMRVFPESTAFVAATQALGSYIFALGETTMESVDMNGTLGSDVTTSSNVVFNTPFKFAAGSGATVSFSSSDTKVVSVIVPRSVIPSTAKYFKVRVDGAQDPAGNLVSAGGANAADKTADNVKAGLL